MKKYYIVFVILFTCTIGLYCHVFHYGFSIQSTDWGNFGSFFDGFLNPILTAINILVFVKLTMTVSNLDDERAKRDAKAQQDLLLMQFRKKEIDNFENAINRIFFYQESRPLFADYSMNSLAEPIVETELYLQTFLRTKLSIFSLNEKSKIVHEIEKLYEKIKDYHKHFLNNMSIEEEERLSILSLSASIINSLQKITLNQ